MTAPVFPTFPEETAIPSKRSYTRRDFVFSLIFFLFGYLAANAMPFREKPLAIFLLTLLAPVIAISLGGKGFFSRSPYFLGRLLTYAVAALAFLTSGNAVLRFFVMVLELVLFALLLYRPKSDQIHLADETILFHIRNALMGYFRQFGALFGALVSGLSQGERAKKSWRTLGFVAVGLSVAILPTLIVVLLLSYDSTFYDLINSIFDVSFDNVFETLWKLLLAFPIGAVFFSVCSQNRFAAKPRTPHKAVSGHSVARPILYAAVTPILLVYALFFFSQKDYYLSAFTKILPEGFTYAEYAREGFFQLCIVSCLNAVILLIFTYLIDKKEGEKEIPCRIYSGLLSLFTLILVATALSKMVLYIDSYGLTHKRVYASWLMLVLAVIFLFFFIKQFARKLPIIKSTLLVVLISFLLIALPNTDALIADYNVDRYLEGELATVDVEELNELGVSSVEARLRLETYWQEQIGVLGTTALTEDEKASLETLSASLNQLATTLQDDTLFAFSLPNARAKRLLEDR